ncbi:MAG TPA: tetratricopeptide repeat protein, partial [Gemmataceae bacterium]|nr:tetratricopeptide repeat protein [Gemmataceae bacterium]
ALAPYGVIDNPRWRDGSLVTALPPAKQERLVERVGGLLFAWAEAEMRWAGDDPEDGRKQNSAFARRLMEQAVASGGGTGTGLAEWAILRQKLGPGDHRALAERATHTPPRTADDHFFLGRALARLNEWKLAIPHFQEAVRLEPKHFWALNNLGNCYFDLGQRRDALACYGACVGLAGDDPLTKYFAHYHRGLAYRSIGAYSSARADLETALALLPNLPADLLRRERPKAHRLLAETLIESGQSAHRPADLAEAEKVLDTAIGMGDGLPLLHFRRGEVRKLRRDKSGAGRDWEAVLALQPSDEWDWTFRGLAHLQKGDAKAALAAFDRALAFNPAFYLALQNKANVLSEKLGNDDESLIVQDRLVGLYPDYVKARIGRAVLLARRGQRQDAHADAAAALALDRSGETYYMAANVYALTSRKEPKDADRVLPLLAAALLNGFGFDEVADDPDMAPVRSNPWFRQVINAARAVMEDASSQAGSS